MGIRLSSEQIEAVMANADIQARERGLALEETQLARSWEEDLNFLRRVDVPRTYLPVLTSLVIARCLYGADVVDVRAIQAGASVKGYAASSIGNALSRFAKEHAINLRATSSAPFNNQPFTFKKYLDSGWSVQRKFEAAWHRFNRMVDRVEAMSSAEAVELLALIFEANRKHGATLLHVEVRGGLESYERVVGKVCAYVDETISNGMVGQAFVAALLDVVFGESSVELGAIHDPDARKPGDVHVGDEVPWMWAEAKQKAITTGDIDGFVNKVADLGGDRVVYFALQNHAYSPGMIKKAAVMRHAADRGVHLDLVDSPKAACEWALPLAPGKLGDVATRLVARLHARMMEIGCDPAMLGDVAAIAENNRADGMPGAH